MSIEENIFYLGGVWVGDGNIRTPHLGNYECFEFRLRVTSKEFFESVVESIEELGHDYYTREKDDRGNKLQYCVYSNSRELVLDLVTRFNNRKFPISGDIESINDNLLREFMRGVYESDGSLKRGNRVVIHQADKDASEGFSKILEEVGINNKIYHRDRDGRCSMYRVVVNTRSYQTKFYNDISPVIKNGIDDGDLKQSALHSVLEL